MQWYYSKNGSQIGPIDQNELLTKISSGEMLQSDLVWREGMADWLPVSKVNELIMTTQSRPAIPSVANVGNGMRTPYAPPATQMQVPAPQGGAEIPNYLWQSIVVTILCCWPFGIPAIVFAAKVEGLKSRGDIAGAMAASASAKMWCKVAGGLGLGVLLIWLLLMGAGLLASHH